MKTIKIHSNNKQMHHKMKTIRSENHQLGSYEINKVSLSCFDDKRYIHEDGITSYAYGHKNIEHQSYSLILILVPVLVPVLVPTLILILVPVSVPVLVPVMIQGFGSRPVSQVLVLVPTPILIFDSYICFPCLIPISFFLVWVYGLIPISFFGV